MSRRLVSKGKAIKTEEDNETRGYVSLSAFVQHTTTSDATFSQEARWRGGEGTAAVRPCDTEAAREEPRSIDLD